VSIVWGVLALCQCAAKDFGSLLAIRILLGVFEAGFFAGATFYLTLFYTRGEMGFRLAIMQSFAVLASAFSGLISFGVFQINDPAVKGWQWLFIIEGAMTLITGVVGFFILPDSAPKAWFLDDREKAAATARLLRDTSSEVNTSFDLKACFETWNDWKFPVWCLITFTYPVAYATAMNFFPLAGFKPTFIEIYLTIADCAPARILRSQDQSVDSRAKSCRRNIFTMRG
jgi:MFS family permease